MVIKEKVIRQKLPFKWVLFCAAFFFSCFLRAEIPNEFGFLFAFNNGPNVKLQFPRGVALDGSDNVYVADSQGRNVQVFDSSGSFLFSFNGMIGGGSAFQNPNGIAVDGSGNIYVPDNTLDIERWMRLTFDQKIETAILETMHPPFRFISDNFRMLDVYCNAGPECCIIKFENLVGVKGGGSLERQQAEIYRIADFLDLEITPSEMDFITENLHGLRPVDQRRRVQTFRKGRIGQWKEYFKPEHEQLFNEKFYPLLEKWGYADEVRNQNAL